MIAVLIGPMGCGKTTIGKLVAEQLGCQFFDADDFHSEFSIQKMSAAVPLTDSDRSAWLHEIREIIDRILSAQRDGIIACSALKRSYREKLGIDQKTVKSIYLKVPYEVLRMRVESRNHSFMNPQLLESQLDITEEPVDGLTIDGSANPSEITSLICQHLRAI